MHNRSASRWTTIGAVVLLVAGGSMTGGAPAGAAPATCTQDWRPAASPAYLTPDGQAPAPPVPLSPAPTAEHRAVHVYCDARYVNTVWLGNRVTTFEAGRVARELVARAVYPSVQPGVNPTRGLTGLASWFWASTDASPVRMLPGNGPGIELELRVQTVRWRFGDGTAGGVSGLGTPYPAPSPVRHVFERTGTFTIDAEVVIGARLWYEELIVDLPNGGHTVSLRHDVVQVRSLLHAA